MGLMIGLQHTGELRILGATLEKVGEDEYNIFFKAIDLHSVHGKVGEIAMVGKVGDIFSIDGVEVCGSQLDDPPQWRLAVRNSPGKPHTAGGTFQACRWRNGEDVLENYAQLQLGNADDVDKEDPSDRRGQFVVKIATGLGGGDEDQMQTAMVATTAYSEPRSLWTGLCQFMGDLFKFANPGDPSKYVCPGHGGAPPPVVTGTSDTIWSPDGMYFTQQQANGDLVKYQAAEPWVKEGYLSAKLIG